MVVASLVKRLHRLKRGEGDAAVRDDAHERGAYAGVERTGTSVGEHRVEVSDGSPEPHRRRGFTRRLRRVRRGLGDSGEVYSVMGAKVGGMRREMRGGPGVQEVQRVREHRRGGPRERPGGEPRGDVAALGRPERVREGGVVHGVHGEGRRAVGEDAGDRRAGSAPQSGHALLRDDPPRGAQRGDGGDGSAGRDEPVAVHLEQDFHAIYRSRQDPRQRPGRTARDEPLHRQGLGSVSSRVIHR